MAATLERYTFSTNRRVMALFQTKVAYTDAMYSETETTDYGTVAIVELFVPGRFFKIMKGTRLVLFINYKTGNELATS